MYVLYTYYVSGDILSVLIIANPRSFNKGIAHLNALRELNHTVYLLVNRDPSEDELITLMTMGNILVCNFNDFDQIANVLDGKQIDFVAVLSENLLVLQHKIELYLGLDTSMPLSSAEILSNKLSFDQFCTENDIPVPRHTLIKHKDQFDIDYPCITKATIGSGQYYTIRNDDVYFEYRKFTNGSEFREYLECNDLMTKFLDCNNNGLLLERYARVPLHFYTQEYIYAENEYCTTGAIVNGVPYFYLTGQLMKYSEMPDLTVDSMNEYGKKQHFTEHLTYIMNKPEQWLVEKFDRFYSKLIDKLKIRSMFFSGPDIYMNDKEYFVDLNSRLSGQFNLIYKKIAPNSVINTWKSLLYKEPMQDYELIMSAASGYPIITQGTYTKVNELHNDNVDFIRFSDILEVPQTRRNMDNKDIREKIVVYGKSSEDVKINYLTATISILDAYKKNTHQ